MGYIGTYMSYIYTYTYIYINYTWVTITGPLLDDSPKFGAGLQGFFGAGLRFILGFAYGSFMVDLGSIQCLCGVYSMLGDFSVFS